MNTALSVILSYDLTAKKSDIPTITEALKKFYFKGKPVTTETAQGLIDVSMWYEFHQLDCTLTKMYTARPIRSREKFNFSSSFF